MTDFESQSGALLDWFTAQDGTAFHPHLKITDLRNRNAGRGIVATATIPANAALFTIPRTSLLSSRTSSLAQKLPDLSTPSAPWAEDEDVSSEKQWLELILVLIYEYLHTSSTTTTKSPWTPYLNTLPATFDTPLFWTDDEIQELQASDLRKRIGRENADKMLQTYVVATIRKHPEVFPDGLILDDESLLNLAHRMGSIIMAYAFDLDPLESSASPSPPPEEVGEDGWIEDKTAPTQLAMVPMADMLNADAEFNAYLNHEEDALVMTSVRKITPGEQILNYYGPLPTSDLVRRYGYYTDKFARYDVVELDGQFVMEKWACFDGNLDLDTNQAVDIKRLMEEIVEEEESFIIERDTEECGPDENGQFTAGPGPVSSSLSMFEKMIVKFMSKIDPGKKDAARLVFVHFALMCVHGKVKQYPTSIAEDEELLASETLSYRKTLAVQVRLGEKKLLAEYASQLNGREDKLLSEIEQQRQNAIANGDGPREPKRRKLPR